MNTQEVISVCHDIVVNISIWESIWIAVVYLIPVFIIGWAGYRLGYIDGINDSQ